MKYFFLISFLILNTLNTAFADRIAIIGGGASGLISAWLIEQKHTVVLYEANDRLGGHVDTRDINVNGIKIPIECGAEFFNEPYYPHFMKLLRHFAIPLQSFTLVSNFYNTSTNTHIFLPPFHDGIIEWDSVTLDNLKILAQLGHVVDAGKELIEAQNRDMSLQTFLDSVNFLNKEFKIFFFYPFAASQWGVTPEEVVNFSAYNIMLYVVQGNKVPKYQWYEATYGLKQYIDSVRNSLQNTTIRLNSPVHTIAKDHDQYIVFDNHDAQKFDQIIFATDANTTGALLGGMPGYGEVVNALMQVRYYYTDIAIHGDRRYMPANEKDWRLANIRYDGFNSALTVYKHWKAPSPIFKTWLTHPVGENPNPVSLPDKLYQLVRYKHVFIDQKYYFAHDIALAMQGVNKIWFAGIWTSDKGSHEGAVNSAIDVAQHLTPDSDRLKVLLCN